MTRSENIQHSIDNGLQKSNGRNLILSKSQLEEIKNLYLGGKRAKEIAELFGYSRSGISKRIKMMELV